VTVWITAGVAAILVAAPLAILALRAAGRLKPETFRELIFRCATWAVLAALIIGPILLGAAWAIGMVGLLSLACYAEYVRVMDLRGERAINTIVVLWILLITFAVLDHWYAFFMALFPLGVVLIAVTALCRDQPQGYIRRVSLPVLGFMLVGCALGHLAYIANDKDYRPMMLLLFLGVGLNDVFAYLCGKTFGRRKLAPNTSPNKTIAGAVGALLLTGTLTAFLARPLFLRTELSHPLRLAVLGLVISVAGQLGDLVMSSIKRDVGIKDTGAILPGHGGLLDRFNSMLLAAPAFFHYVGYFVGFGLDQPMFVITGPHP
jgi:phosphatidate cytidylyltransferase